MREKLQGEYNGTNCQYNTIIANDVHNSKLRKAYYNIFLQKHKLYTR